MHEHTTNHVTERTQCNDNELANNYRPQRTLKRPHK